MAGTDPIALLTEDHREAEQMFEQIQALVGRDAETLRRKQELTEQVITELIRHSVAEEEYLYPTVRDAVPGGAALADKEISDHSEAEKTMKELEKLSPDNVDFDSTFITLVGQVKQHVASEEGELFPKLQQACTAGQLDQLGGKLSMAKKMAPTRPHPSSPSTPPANKLLGPFVGLVDRMRDALTGHGAKS